MKHADKKSEDSKKCQESKKYIYTTLLPLGIWLWSDFTLKSWKSPSLCCWAAEERGARQQAAHLSFHIWRETRKRGGIGRVVHKFSLFWGNLMALQLFFLRGLELIWLYDNTQRICNSNNEYELHKFFFFSISRFITRLNEGGRGVSPIHNNVTWGVLQSILQYYIFTDLVGKVGM